MDSGEENKGNLRALWHLTSYGGGKLRKRRWHRRSLNGDKLSRETHSGERKWQISGTKNALLRCTHPVVPAADSVVMATKKPSRYPVIIAVSIGRYRLSHTASTAPHWREYCHNDVGRKLEEQSQKQNRNLNDKAIRGKTPWTSSWFQTFHQCRQNYLKWRMNFAYRSRITGFLTIIANDFFYTFSETKYIVHFRQDWKLRIVLVFGFQRNPLAGLQEVLHNRKYWGKKIEFFARPKTPSEEIEESRNL